MPDGEVAARVPMCFYATLLKSILAQPFP
jgi:hypothetical protein